MLMTRPREEWLHDVAARYRALEQFTQEDSRLQFLRILRSLPYGARCCVGNRMPQLCHNETADAVHAHAMITN